MLASQQTQDTIVFGYVREAYSFSIPTSLIKLCALYYNHIFNWHFSGKSLEKLLCMKDADTLYCNKLIKLNHATFRCVLKVTNRSDTNRQTRRQINAPRYPFVQFAVELDKRSQNISNMTIYHHYYCPQLNISQKEISGADYISSIGEFLFEMKEKKSLTFMCDIDILEINYRNTSETYRKQNVSLSQHICYIWKVTDLAWRKTVYSPSFDNGNWSMTYFYDPGSGDELVDYYEDEYLQINLQLFHLPSKVRRIKISVKKYVFVANEWKQKNDSIFEFSYGQYSNDCSMDCSNFSELKIVIDILELYDLNGKTIAHEKWEEYGIVIQ